MDCKGASQCNVGHEQSKSFSIGFEATAAVPWFSGGFAVQKSWTTGNTYQCTGTKWQTVCIKYRTAMTAYTINTGSYWACNGATIWKPENVIMWSPNQGNKGGAYYCEIGAKCIKQGQAWMQTEGYGVRPGGP